MLLTQQIPNLKFQMGKETGMNVFEILEIIKCISPQDAR